MPATKSVDKRRCAAAMRIRTFLQAYARDSIKAVYFEMFRRHVAGERAMNAHDMYKCGKFVHGHELDRLLNAAKQDGLVKRGAACAPVLAPWSPSKRLLGLVQKEVDLEIAAWRRILQ